MKLDLKKPSLSLRKPVLELKKAPVQNPVKMQDGKYVRNALVKATSLAKNMV